MVVGEYRICDSLLCKTEMIFYRGLIEVFGKEFTVMCKVRLGDIFRCIASDENVKRELDLLVMPKHVDFLLCDRETLRPICAIELDGSSHHKRERSDRDKDKIFRNAGLGLFRFKVSEEYDYKPLKLFIEAFLNSDTSGFRNVCVV